MMKRFLKWLVLGGVFIGAVLYCITPGPTIPPITLQMERHAAGVEIYRDTWGVAHIFGQTDADTAFGLAYTEAEDDWPTIVGSLMASRGQLSRVLWQKMALQNDYLSGLFSVPTIVSETYDHRLSPGLKAVLVAFAEGLNYYAARHPAEISGHYLPFTPQDVLASFVLKELFMEGAIDIIAHLGDAPKLTARRNPQSIGSNAHALHRSRSTDDVTRLNINSHQPWEGPVAWHEVQVHSKEGWDMSGGTFPGAPMIFHGYNDHLGWAHTVNAPDLVDVYELVVRSEGGQLQYRLDGKWEPLTVKRIPLMIDLGFCQFTIHKDGFESAHGPVLKVNDRYLAIRVAGFKDSALAAEQWFRMNHAKDFASWMAAMRLQHLPMFNTVYADRDTIYYVYNGSLPVRPAGQDYKGVLPGDRSDLIWNKYLPFDQLPQVQNPPAGYVMSCNNPPFFATEDPANPDRAKYGPQFGIETELNNRGIRSRELLGSNRGKLSREQFLAMKWDRQYDRRGSLYRMVLDPLFATKRTWDALEEQALSRLKTWDGAVGEDSTTATLAVLIGSQIQHQMLCLYPDPPADPVVVFQSAVRFLKEHYQTLDVPLKSVQYVHRGDGYWPIGGGPDLLNAVDSHREGARLVGQQGDSYVCVVEFGPKTRASAIHQYGNVNRPLSRHYADQVPLFVRRELRPVLRTREELERAGSKPWHPGAEPYL
jgi:acyl-homoserine-lactone acylase